MQSSDESLLEDSPNGSIKRSPFAQSFGVKLERIGIHRLFLEIVNLNRDRSLETLETLSHCGS